MVNYQLDRANSEIPRYQQKRKRYRRFNASLLGIALFPVFTVGLINYIVDPYGIFKTPTRLGFNLLKPSQDDQTRLFKAVEITQVKPRRLLLGSSRAILGLNPAHEVFRDDLVTYNLGLTGPNIKDIRQYFEHSLINQPDIEQVILSLDFFTFNSPNAKTENSDNSILGKRQIPLGEFVRLTLSLDTLKSSEKTLEDNRTSKLTEPYYFYGMRRDTYNSQKKDRMNAFRYQLGNYLRTFYKDYQLAPESLQELEKIIALAKERNIDLKVFISPIHATQMETIDRAGLWEKFETWKREVSKITPVWDFATFNRITEEPIANNMKNFHDSAHYTKEVGDSVLDRVFSYPLEKVPPDFGNLITPQNIESHLQQIRDRREEWRKSHPEERQLVLDIARKTQPVK